MIWFLSFQLLGLLLIFIALYSYCRYRYLRYFRFLWKHKKRIAIAEVIIFVIITLVCIKPLYNTTQCYFQGVSRKSETKYSWYLTECQVKTKSGSYVPIPSARGLPDGGKEDQNVIDGLEDTLTH